MVKPRSVDVYTAEVRETGTRGRSMSRRQRIAVGLARTAAPLWVGAGKPVVMRRRPRVVLLVRGKITLIAAASGGRGSPSGSCRSRHDRSRRPAVVSQDAQATLLLLDNGHVEQIVARARSGDARRLPAADRCPGSQGPGGKPGRDGRCRTNPAVVQRREGPVAGRRHRAFVGEGAGQRRSGDCVRCSTPRCWAGSRRSPGTPSRRERSTR